MWNGKKIGVFGIVYFDVCVKFDIVSLMSVFELELEFFMVSVWIKNDFYFIKVICFCYDGIWCVIIFFYFCVLFVLFFLLEEFCYWRDCTSSGRASGICF